MTNPLKRSAFVLFISISLLAFSTNAAEPVYHLETDGIVIFDAESADIDADWLNDTTVAGYQGTGYIVWTGPNHFAKRSAGQGTIKYNVSIGTAGNYELRWRSRITTGDSHTDHNDSWVRFATSSDVAEEQPLLGKWIKAYMNRLNTWSWDTNTVDFDRKPIRQYFAAGDHTVEVSARSAGHGIDRIALYRYADVNFSESTFNNLPNSDTTTEPSGEPDQGAGDDSGGTDSGTTDSGTTDSGGADTGGTTDGGDTSDGGTDSGTADAGTGGSDTGGGTDTSGGTDPNTDSTLIPPVSENEEHPAGVCLNNTLSLSPTIGADTDFQTYTSGPYLHIAGDTRRALLRFDLTNVPPLSSAELRYQTAETDAVGGLDIYLASHSNWETLDSEQDQPNSIALLANVTGRWLNNTRYAQSLDASLLTAQVTSFVLEMQPGDDNLTLHGHESIAYGPRLVLKGGESFCSDLALAKSATDPDTDSETDTDTNTDTDTDTESMTDEEDADLGSWGLLSLLVMSIVGMRRRQRRA